MARPIPRVEPVTSATLCERRLPISRACHPRPATARPPVPVRARVRSYTRRGDDCVLAHDRALVVRDPARHAASAPRSAARAGLRAAPRSPVRRARARVPRPRVHGLEERRRHELRADRDRRRQPRLPRLLEQGRRAARQGRPLHRPTRPSARPSCARSSRSAPTSAGSASIKLEPQDHDTAFRSFHRDDNNRFNPDTEGWVVRSWIELTDFPESYMLLMDTGPDGLPDPATEVRLPLRPRCALRARHAAAVARRRAQRERAPLRADLQLRERSRARRLDHVPVVAELRERGGRARR